MIADEMITCEPYRCRLLPRVCASRFVLAQDREHDASVTKCRTCADGAKRAAELNPDVDTRPRWGGIHHNPRTRTTERLPPKRDQMRCRGCGGSMVNALDRKMYCYDCRPEVKIGMMFGKRTIIGWASHRMWVLRCPCGKESVVRENDLHTRASRQCLDCSRKVRDSGRARYLTDDSGIKLRIVEWAKRKKMSATTISTRLRSGWDEHEAIHGRRPK